MTKKEKKQRNNFLQEQERGKKQWNEQIQDSKLCRQQYNSIGENKAET